MHRMSFAPVWMASTPQEVLEFMDEDAMPVMPENSSLDS